MSAESRTELLRGVESGAVLAGVLPTTLHVGVGAAASAKPALMKERVDALGTGVRLVVSSLPQTVSPAAPHTRGMDLCAFFPLSWSSREVFFNPKTEFFTNPGGGVIVLGLTGMPRTPRVLLELSVWFDGGAVLTLDQFDDSTPFRSGPTVTVRSSSKSATDACIPIVVDPAYPFFNLTGDTQHEWGFRSATISALQ
jgi:hypothetical protein